MAVASCHGPFAAAVRAKICARHASLANKGLHGNAMAYVSEATRFLEQLLESHPELRELRQRNRATWWDHPQDLDEQREREAARVPQGAYVYFPRPRPPKDGA